MKRVESDEHSKSLEDVSSSGEEYEFDDDDGGGDESDDEEDNNDETNHDDVHSKSLEDAGSTSGSGEEDEEYDDGDDEEDNNDEKNNDDGRSGLANVMAKILSTKKSDNVVLSKAKKDWAVKMEEDSDDDQFEVVDSSGKVKIEPMIKSEIKKEPKHMSTHKPELMHKLWVDRFRVKPDLQKDHEKERKLKIIATQGVVQLFSAIEKHKTVLQKKISETRSIMGREMIMESTGKEAFMEMLREQGKKIKREDDEDKIKSDVKEEPIDIPVAKKPKWNVFADNFYKEPTLQGWDQQSDDDAD